ncbi:hypothetical protein EJ04DRAFT_582518 [Polyplosphaeria fusca]|uniref:DUF6594 domain-containing protein n=1 Tax=Polyplosphaeria fusca TaxID=682080 RepID=A0A9P4QG81_9PLEO|nr:hypothetical protein EJ04DRAFT_582518 [Polyplosphaeria fusca]
MSVLPLYRQPSQFDSFRSGYPKFTALLALHPAFQNFRRFSRVRLRLLLVKQDEIVELESSLDQIDTQEKRALFLGCRRRDTNNERQELLSKMRISISEYDSMMKDYQHALHLPDANQRDVVSVQNWINGTGCIARAETAYLDRIDDLAGMARSHDGASHRTEIAVEKIASILGAFIRKRLQFLPEAMKPGRSDLTKDTNIFLMGRRLRFFVNVVTSAIVAAILLAPVVALFCIRSALGRLIM